MTRLPRDSFSRQNFDNRDSICLPMCGGFSPLNLPKFQVVTMLVIGVYYLSSTTRIKLRSNYIDLLPTINFNPSNSCHHIARNILKSPHLSFTFLIVIASVLYLNNPQIRTPSADVDSDQALSNLGF
jgi:hypothetical protein